MNPRVAVLCALLVLGYCGLANAQDAPPAAPAGAAPATGTWPRMFFSPEERREVTARRLAALDGNRPLVAATNEDGAAAGVAARPASPRVDGISLVRGARYAAWIGGRRVEDGGRWDGYRLRVTREGVQFIDAAGAARLVKVGQPVRPTGRPAS